MVYRNYSLVIIKSLVFRYSGRRAARVVREIELLLGDTVLIQEMVRLGFISLLFVRNDGP